MKQNSCRVRFAVANRQLGYLKAKTVGETDMQYYVDMMKVVVELKAVYITMKPKPLKHGTEEPTPKMKCENVKKT